MNATAARMIGTTSKMKKVTLEPVVVWPTISYCSSSVLTILGIGTHCLEIVLSALDIVSEQPTESHSTESARVTRETDNWGRVGKVRTGHLDNIIASTPVGGKTMFQNMAKKRVKRGTCQGHNRIVRQKRESFQRAAKAELFKMDGDIVRVVYFSEIAQ